MHTSDTVQEKLSLYARFGVSIYFGAPNKKEFQNIVKVLAEKYQVSMDEDTLLAEANKWELSTVDYPAGRHSNLSTIYLEKNKKLV